MPFFPDYNDILKEKLTFLAIWTVTPTVMLLLFGCGRIPSALLVILTISSIWMWIMRSRKLASNGKAVLITGCGSGFGLATACKLHELGFTVFATCLSLEGEGVNKLLELQSDKFHVFQLDITSEKDVQQAFQYVSSNRSPKSKGLWALINNAGIMDICNCENTSMETYGKILAVNLSGHIRMTKTFLTLLEKANGRVVNVCSIFSHTGGPFLSAYVASKWALKGFSECIRKELSPKGMRVITIDPGNFVKGTNLSPSPEVEEAKWLEEKYPYDEKMRATYAAAYSIGKSDVSQVVDSMVDAVHSTYPATNYIPGSTFDKLLMLSAGLIPTFISDLMTEKGASLIALLTHYKFIKH